MFQQESLFEFVEVLGVYLALFVHLHRSQDQRLIHHQVVLVQGVGEFHRKYRLQQTKLVLEHQCFVQSAC